ncbi:hypothetical protein [Caulobacter sp. NIBR1757]|uniref:hypothetical protein n=1 Tax=Caulobacter sp. NIBR1757 TaxID=3016000 RepID=UPI0022F13FC0|nr:hypothetical protein [Caulobacter sp. NIBR1757]WGM40762.1 hypothetical protein AMEJIAPC_03709 [Caulobacter sp. NIBR1757]
MTELTRALEACAVVGTFPTDLVGDAMRAMGEGDLAERVYSASEGMPWEAVAEFFSCAVWQTSDNGTQILRTTDQWLTEGQDERKVAIALHVDAYPFLDAAEMEQVLRETAVRFPQFAAKCADMIKGRGGRS